jgi:hypothetical protein
MNPRGIQFGGSLPVPGLNRTLFLENDSLTGKSSLGIYPDDSCATSGPVVGKSQLDVTR